MLLLVVAASIPHSPSSLMYPPQLHPSPSSTHSQSPSSNATPSLCGPGLPITVSLMLGPEQPFKPLILLGALCLPWAVDLLGGRGPAGAPNPVGGLLPAGGCGPARGREPAGGRGPTSGRGTAEG
ncbi:hypothetical protein XELAEV_18004208mg [Xenopus laevis]|uniref:Uncharacterized protein n=1 Tax=Xenopus laevis TaxID=8355 RepID=A0A974BQ66_XENLA|nr:hypothetical protein XELAEV_18004208mg [Xenopus laevis]